MVRELSAKIHVDREIIELRPAKNSVDPGRPYHFLAEQEYSHDGQVDLVATLFLVNRECPFRCLMCDLWKNTTDDPVPRGAIPAQIQFALRRLPESRHLKLYNSGNFFDPQAIPPDDDREIAKLVGGFDTVIVENHPRFCGDRCLRFRDLLSGTLEVAIGLETIHPEVLPRLNKQMTLDDFRRATEFLLANGIRVRAFILLKPPFLSEEAAIEWTLRSVDFAQSLGVNCCSIIPTRSGNGIMDRLQASSDFSPPRLRSLEIVLESCLSTMRRRVFVDLWDAERFAACGECRAPRIARMRAMNLSQSIPPVVDCDCAGFNVG